MTCVILLLEDPAAGVVERGLDSVAVRLIVADHQIVAIPEESRFASGVVVDGIGVRNVLACSVRGSCGD
jgi:hypothetical protein